MTKEQATALHPSSVTWTVICEDLVVRHPEPFTSKHAAQDFAWWGHCCTASHVIQVTA